MNLRIYATKAFVQALKKHRYRRVILEKIQLLALNPRHPSLNVHQVRRARKGIWECYVSDGDRMLYESRSGELYLWYLGSHALIERVQCYRFDPEQTFYALEEQEGDGQVRETAVPYEADGRANTELLYVFPWEKWRQVGDSML